MILKSKTKGQFIVVGAIVIIVSLIMIKDLLGVYSTIQTTSYEETKILEKQLENIKNEYEYIVGIASMQSDVNRSVVLNLSNFSSYIRDQLDSEIFWLGIYVNGTSQNYSVNAGNFLQNDITVTLTPTDSIPESVELSLSDGTVQSATFASQINGTINLTVSYTIKGVSREDIVLFNVSTYNSTAGFFDIKLLSDDLVVRTKDVYERRIV